MQNKTVFEYKEKHHILEVDGVEYEIPQRTAELEKKIREHDEKLKDMTEYEGNMSMLETLFGKANAKKMFPDKEKTNLDKLSKCTSIAIGLFMHEYNTARTEEMKNKMSEVQPFLTQIKSTTNALKNAQSKVEFKKAVSKK